MPVLPNPRHEVFAQELAKGKPACDAYEVAGYNPSRSSASRLQQNADISARVDELLATREQIHAQATERAVQRTALTKEWVIEGLMENAQRALQRQAVLDDDGKPVGEYHYQGQVANRAFELLGKELGMFIERRETGAPGEFAGIDGMSAEELKAFVLSRPLPAPSPDKESDKTLN
jgi:phage terminase small subunit